MTISALDYTSLMSRRIRSILLVCNNYDSYTLEEDGHIEDLITREYADLNISNPPSITRVESTPDALSRLEDGERFDLVITLYNVGRINVFDFSARAKQLCPETPIVLLTSFSREVYKTLDNNDTSNIDYVFCWNNSTDLIIAIIKLLEDRMNAEADISSGVRAILLVEDSVRYYSTYLPLLYRLILNQNSVAIKDALNEKQQTQRKRSRPKILMATCYDEAMELYEKYKKNILGIISDVGFVMHKGEKSFQEKSDAGVQFCRIVKEDNPRMPVLMQSSQENMRQTAVSMGLGFIYKRSKTLTQELSDFIEKEFGFGDFVVTDPQTGDEIARASDLNGFEKIIKSISIEDFKRLANNNYLSKWLFARGLFSIGKVLSELRIKDETDLEAHRANDVKLIHDYRIAQGLGVVAAFNPDSFNDAIWFSRLGNGSLGGKARGLAFLNHILQKYELYDHWEDVRVLVPRTLVITTEYFDRFIKDNGLQYVINADISDEDILSEFVASSLPEDLNRALRKFIHYTRKPLAVRSSSKLEDSYYQPFAGVYSTYMIPHACDEHQQLRLLSKAIKSVYASVYYASSRAYITASANVISEEKMAIVVQEVCGREQGNYYFPAISGVARSYNFYPVGHEKAEEGVCKIAYGLGKAIVDGDQVLRFSPKYPKHVIQTSTPEHTMRETQKSVFALNLQPDKFRTSVDDAVNLERIPVSGCSGFSSFARVASTFDYNNQRMVDNAFAEGPKFITFAHILKYNMFPLAEIVARLLEIADREMKCGVEIEFAVDLGSGDSPANFNVLQIRPISLDTNASEVDWNKIDCSNPLLYSSNSLGVGWIGDIQDIVYLRPQAFDTLKTVQMAAEVSRLNAEMAAQGRGYLLIGFGRWGSSIPSLGVPVKWSDISEAKAIVECCLEDFRVDPSQGTHFFQNLTSFNVGYINVDPFKFRSDKVDFERLDSHPAVYESELVRHIRFERPLDVCIDGRSGKSIVNECGKDA